MVVGTAVAVQRRVATTVAEDKRQGDGELEEAKIPTPQGGADRLGSAAMTKQVAIAAADHDEAALDEADHRVTQRRRLPRIARDTLCAVDRDGDLAIAGAVCPTIDGLHHQA